MGEVYVDWLSESNSIPAQSVLPLTILALLNGELMRYQSTLFISNTKITFLENG
jgi:hypothetical protein